MDHQCISALCASKWYNYLNHMVCKSIHNIPLNYTHHRIWVHVLPFYSNYGGHRPRKQQITITNLQKWSVHPEENITEQTYWCQFPSKWNKQKVDLWLDKTNSVEKASTVCNDLLTYITGPHLLTCYFHNSHYPSNDM